MFCRPGLISYLSSTLSPYYSLLVKHLLRIKLNNILEVKQSSPISWFGFAFRLLLVFVAAEDVVE